MRMSKLLMVGVLGGMAATLQAAPEEGDKAPEIKAGAWMNLPEGMKSLSPGDLKGRVVMIDFWATW